MNVNILYNKDILRLATSLIAGEHLESADACCEARSPTCGSRIAVDIMIDENHQIADLAIRANACALGQASAAILRANAKGQDQATILAIRTGLANSLQGKAIPPPIWPALQQLAVARDFPARHAAILLPYDAVLAALEQLN